MGTVVLLRNAMSALIRAVPVGSEELSEAGRPRGTQISGGHSVVAKVSARWHKGSCNGQTPPHPLTNQPISALIARHASALVQNRQSAFPDGAVLETCIGLISPVEIWSIIGRYFPITGPHLFFSAAGS